MENNHNYLVVPEEKKVFVRLDEYSTKVFHRDLKHLYVTGYKVFYVSEETLRKEKLKLKHSREVKRKTLREEQLNRPIVDESIRDIQDLESLITFLIDYYNEAEVDNIQEYSIDKERSEAEHEANMEMLNNKKALYLRKL